MSGIDAGWRFVVNSKVNTSGTFSVLKLDSIIQKPGDPVEATSLNSPTMKATVGMDAKDLPAQTFGGFTMRFVKDYKFLSGVHNGRIPGLLAFDFNVGKRLTSNLVLNMSVQNLFACTSGTTTQAAFLNAGLPSAYQRGWGCGLGRKHIELLNMPALGSMTFIGLRFDR